MNGKTKRFFVLKNIKSLISRQQDIPDELNNNTSSDIVAEAERIVENYLYRIGYDKVSKPRRGRTHLVFAAISSATLVAATYIIIRFVI